MRSVLVVHSLDRTYAVPLVHVLEVSRFLPTEPVSGAPAYVLGLARARGKATPVVDLNRLLGEASAGPGGRFVSLRVDERRVILAVDAAREIRSLDDHAFEALPPLLAQSAAHLQGLAVLDGRLLAVLDASKLLSALPDDASVGGSLGQG